MSAASPVPLTNTKGSRRESVTTVPVRIGEPVVNVADSSAKAAGAARRLQDRLLALDRDALDAFSRFVGLWKRDRQDAIFERRLGVVLLDILEGDLALERP